MIGDEAPDGGAGPRRPPLPQHSQDQLRPGSGRQTTTVGLVLATVVVVLILAGSIGLNLVQSVLTPGTRVAVAAHDIPLRSRLEPGDLRLALVTSHDVLPGGYSRVEDVTRGGVVAQVSIAKGQQVTSNMLARHGDEVVGPQPAYLPIPKGFVATTIPDGERAGVAGYIQVGDYINVVLSIDDTQFREDKGGLVTRTVFANLHVVRAGQATGEVTGAGQGGASTRAASSAGASSLTVIMTQCDAEYMDWLTLHGRLTYTLPSYKDYQPQDTKPDPACPSAATTHGVGPRDVDARWHLSDIGGIVVNRPTDFTGPE